MLKSSLWIETKRDLTLLIPLMYANPSKINMKQTSAIALKRYFTSHFTLHITLKGKFPFTQAHQKHRFVPVAYAIGMFASIKKTSIFSGV